MKIKNRVLAVLALVLLMINMLPVKRAEAAETSDGVYYPNLLTDVDLGTYDEEIRNICDTYPCIVVTKGINTDYYKYYFLTEASSKELQYYPSWGKCICFHGSVIVDVESDVVLSVSSNPNNNLQVYFNCIGGNCDNELIGTNFSFTYSSECSKNDGYDAIYDEISAKTNNLVHPNDMPELEPLLLPVTEPGYSYWLYQKTTNGEYMYWSKEPFDLEVWEENDGKYILNLSTGDIVYRLHMNPSHSYYRQVLPASLQFSVSSGDIFRSGQALSFDGITIDAWTEGDVTSEEVERPQYDIPHITKFLSRIRSVRSLTGKPREYSMSIDLALSGEFDKAVTEQKVLIDGNYILPSEEYFRFCDSEGIDPSTTHFMKFVKNKQEEYYIFVEWSHIESIVNLAGLTSDYGFRLTYSNAVDALIERGEFDSLYSKSVQASYGNDIRKLCCPYRLVCTLIGVVDGEYYYGDTFITVLYSEMDKTIADVSGVYSDYVSLDKNQKTDVIESTINEAQSDQLQEYIDKKDAELDALIEEYEMKLITLDSTLSKVNIGSDDLFVTFSSIANGLSGLSGSFRNLSLAVGNVFAFFPEEITGILFAGIVAMIIIAVYKALRG